MRGRRRGRGEIRRLPFHERGVECGAGDARFACRRAELGNRELCSASCVQLDSPGKKPMRRILGESDAFEGLIVHGHPLICELSPDPDSEAVDTRMHRAHWRKVGRESVVAGDLFRQRGLTGPVRRENDFDGVVAFWPESPDGVEMAAVPIRYAARIVPVEPKEVERPTIQPLEIREGRTECCCREHMPLRVAADDLGDVRASSAQRIGPPDGDAPSGIVREELRPESRITFAILQPGGRYVLDAEPLTERVLGIGGMNGVICGMCGEEPEGVRAWCVLVSLRRRVGAPDRRKDDSEDERANGACHGYPVFLTPKLKYNSASTAATHL